METGCSDELAPSDNPASKSKPCAAAGPKQPRSGWRGVCARDEQ
jgi:hypothetical protein